MEQTEQQKKRKADKIESAKRIRIIQDWIMQDHMTMDIINQSMQQFGIESRQAYRYLWAAKKFFEEKETESFERKRSFYLARKKKLLRDMNPEEKKTAAGVSAINRVLDSMAKLEGVSVDTVKLVGDKDNPIHTVTKNQGIDYSLLTEKELITLKKIHDKAAQY